MVLEVRIVVISGEERRSMIEEEYERYFWSAGNVLFVDQDGVFKDMLTL